MFPDPSHMRLALRLARKGVGRTSPNPAVGAVLVRDGRVVGQGWHRKAGLPHAEIEAIAAAGDGAHGADLYVTLEPCSHQGKTGPCAEALLEAGIRRVAAAMEDPNPLVSGKGFARLREGGIEVVAGLLEPEARTLNRGWIRWIRTGRPYVTLKLASTLDGQIAGSSGASRWITGEVSRRRVHRMRAAHDAVLVGGETAFRDDPLLTCRLRGGKNPVRIVVSSRPARLAGLRMFRDASAPNLVAVPEGVPDSAFRPIELLGAEILRVVGSGGTVDPVALCEHLGSRGVTSLLVEGGGRTAGAFLRAGAVDRIVIYYAPLMFGEAVRSVSGWSAALPAEGKRFAIEAVRRSGEDLEVEAVPVGTGEGG